MPPASTTTAVFTTTIFVSGPTSGAGPSSDQIRLPVGSIVGGLLGGIFLAFAAVGGWIWWGKAIERNARKQQPPLRSALKRDPYREGRTEISNASGSRHASRRSTPGAVSQKSVTFAGTESRTPSPAGSLRNGQLDEKTIERGRLGTPPRSAMRSARRSQSSERGYAPVRPSPLSQRIQSSAVSMRAPSPAARSPTPPLRTKRRNSAPPAPSMQRTEPYPRAAVSTSAVNMVGPPPNVGGSDA